MLSIVIDIALSGAKVELTTTQQKAVEKFVKQLLLEGGTTPVITGAPKRKYHKKRKFPFGAKRWTPEQTTNLKREYEYIQKMTPKLNLQMGHLAEIFTRTPGACYVKLRQLGEFNKVKQ